MEKELKKAFLGMKRQEVIDIVKDALGSGSDPLDILKICREAMEAVGERFETGEFFLSELIYSAEVFKAVSAMLEPRLLAGQVGEDSKGAVVFGTPKGDIHDLGKNIVALMLQMYGYDVNDLGRDVPVLQVIEAAKQQGADVIAVSALMTTSMRNMVKLIDALEADGSRDRFKVAIGGAAVSQDYCDDIGADIFAQDAVQAVEAIGRALDS